MVPDRTRFFEMLRVPCRTSSRKKGSLEMWMVPYKTVTGKWVLTDLERTVVGSSLAGPYRKRLARNVE